MSELRIIEDELSGSDIAALLTLHLTEMHQWSPHGSVNAMPPELLRAGDFSICMTYAL